MDTSLGAYAPWCYQHLQYDYFAFGFSTVPVSLEESAMLDGAGHIRILINVVLPLSMHIIAVIIPYYAVAHWNAWFQASIYIKSRAGFLCIGFA